MWRSCAIVFVSSACTLVLELIAGRIMAPYIGVSLYTWTSIIGIVLAGMSIGNFLGGVIADRHASPRLLGVVFIAGSVSSAGILVVTDFIAGAHFGLSLLPRIVFYTLADFFLPSVILGMVSPVVVKLALADLQRTGNTVGTIYACSTVGSIVGTFLTGFWLISWMGTRAIVWAVAAVLLLTGLLVGRFHRSKRDVAVVAGVAVLAAAAAWVSTPMFKLEPGEATSGALLWMVVGGPVLILLAGFLMPNATRAVAAIAIVVISVVAAGWNAGRYRAPCKLESDYYCIEILGTENQLRPARALKLDHLIHSYVVLDDPKALEYGYERAYADITQAYSLGHPTMDTLFLGGGGYAFPRYIEAAYPAATIEVLEIDPEVTKTVHRDLGLPETSRIRSRNGDARMLLMESNDSKQYDVIYGDAFNDLSIPYHLTTVEFSRMIAARLKPGGMYLANVIDKLEGGEFLKAYANALRQSFSYVAIFARGDGLLPFDRNTYVIVASDRPIDPANLATVTSTESSLSRTTAMPVPRLEAYLKSGRALTLTDDFAPVDQLLAALFIERGQ